MGDSSVATPPQPPPGNPYGAPNPYGQPDPYGQSNSYGQPGPYAPPNPANPYGQPQPPQAPQPQSPYGDAIPQQGGYGYPQQQPGIPPQYGQQPPMGQPGWPQPNGLACRFCGGFPAVDVSVRAHRGMIWLMTFRELKGPFCRTCGTAAVRDLSGQTLVQGWWGMFSSVITPITLLINLVSYNKIKALPEPEYRQAPPMDPGKPLMQRPHAAGFLVPAVAFLAILVLVIAGLAGGGSTDNSDGGGGVPVVTDSPTDLPTALPTDTSAPTDAPTDTSTGSTTDSGSGSGDFAVEGQCVKNYGSDNNPDLRIVDCASGTYQVMKKLYDTTSTSGCPSDATTTYTHTETANDFVLCLKQYTG